MCPASENDTTTSADSEDSAADTEETQTPNSISTAESATSDRSVAADSPQKSPKNARRLFVPSRTILVGTAIVSLIAAIVVLSWFYVRGNAKLDDQARAAEDNRHAEQVALDYAVNAAVMDYKDLNPWKQNLVKGTTPELKQKLTKAATAMEQILLPLQWSSSAKPLAAKVRSHENSAYVVDAFVSVVTKTVQAADNLQSTATYSVTIDSNAGWQITDVGGVAAVVGEK